MTTTYRAVVSLLGEALARTLTDRLGGVPIYVPEFPAAGSPLVLALGHGSAALICDRFAGQYIELPSRQALQHRQRREDVVFDLRRGLASSEVARRHGITARHVRRIRIQEIAP